MNSLYENISMEEVPKWDTHEWCEFPQFYCTAHKIDIWALCNIIEHTQWVCKYISRSSISEEVPQSGLQIVKQMELYLNEVI